MANTTKTQITDAQTEYFNSVLLLRAQPFLQFGNVGVERPVPMSMSTQVRFRRYGVLTIITSNLTEGSTPAEVQASITDVTGTLIQRGNAVIITDMVDWTSAEAAWTEIAEVLGQNAGESVDVYYRNVADAGTGVIYANGTARTDVNTTVDTNDLRRVTRVLETNNALRVTTMINAQTGIGSVPIRPAYIAVVHPHVVFSLRQLTPHWHSVETYASQGPVMDGEVGELDGIRFIMTTQGRIYTNGGGAAPTGIQTTGGTLSDVYETLVFGQQSFGRCPLKGKGLVNIRKELGSSGTADPLDQRGSSAWKFTGVAVILNDNFQTRLESAADSGSA